MAKPSNRPGTRSAQRKTASSILPKAVDELEKAPVASGAVFADDPDLYYITGNNHLSNWLAPGDIAVLSPAAEPVSGQLVFLRSLDGPEGIGMLFSAPPRDQREISPDIGVVVLRTARSGFVGLRADKVAALHAVVHVIKTSDWRRA